MQQFFQDIFDLCLTESAEREPGDMEGRRFDPFLAVGPSAQALRFSLHPLSSPLRSSQLLSKVGTMAPFGQRRMGFPRMGFP
jgi:hypothetical protein